MPQIISVTRFRARLFLFKHVINDSLIINNNKMWPIMRTGKESTSSPVA